MYGKFFYWLFWAPFPTRELGTQIINGMLAAVGASVVPAVLVGFTPWLGQLDGTA
jgi:hypothetical protein